MKDYVIRCGTLIDGTGADPVKDACILVRNRRIVRVDRKTGGDLRDFPDQIDASGKTVLPGLIDAHKHLVNSGGSHVGISFDLGQLKENLTQICQSGVTSVLDLGSAYVMHILPKLPVRQPRVFYAISILTCKNGYPAEYMPRRFYPLGAVAECGCRQDVKKNIKILHGMGVSVIKTAMASRTFDGKSQPCWSEDLLQFLTDEAHSFGLKVHTHVTHARDYAQAIRCGCDVIHHAPFDGPMQDRDLEEMIERGIVFVPTVSFGALMVQGLEEKWIYDPRFKPPVNEKIRENLKAFTDSFHRAEEDSCVDGLFIRMAKGEFCRAVKCQSDNVRRFIQKGGTVAMGTDSAMGFSFHTTPLREMEMLHEAGLTVAETVRASTLTAASTFGKEAEIGSLQPGKKADILIVDGSADRNLSALKQVNTVIINGKIFHDKDNCHSHLHL